MTIGSLPRDRSRTAHIRTAHDASDEKRLARNPGDEAEKAHMKGRE